MTRKLRAAPVVMAMVLSTIAMGPTEEGTPTRSEPEDMYDQIVPKDLETIVGIGPWIYTWPHALFPLEPEGFELYSAPVDFTPGSNSRSKGNWHMPSIYISMDGKMAITARVLEHLSIEELEEQSMQIVPLKYWRDPGIQFNPHDFHGLPAASGHLHRETSEADKPPQQRYMAFRIRDLLFLIEGRTGTNHDIEEYVLNFAEHVYERNKEETPRTRNRDRRFAGLPY